MPVAYFSLLFAVQKTEKKRFNSNYTTVNHRINTRSHLEMVGNMLRVTLNFDLSKISPQIQIPFGLSVLSQD